MKKKSQALETVVHGVFLLLGLITVGCVLLISVYLIVSGIPAIRQIGLIPFLFGKTWASTAAEPSYGILPFILTSVYGTAGAVHRLRYRGDSGGAVLWGAGPGK